MGSQDKAAASTRSERTSTCASEGAQTPTRSWLFNEAPQELNV